MKCPECKNALVQRAADGHGIRIRIHGPIVFDEAGDATANCYWCKKPVKIPVRLEQTEPQRFVINAG